MCIRDSDKVGRHRRVCNGGQWRVDSTPSASSRFEQFRAVSSSFLRSPVSYTHLRAHETSAHL
eukprot:10348126-Alexandrium_andersonii.AAC.1